MFTITAGTTSVAMCLFGTWLLPNATTVTQAATTHPRTAHQTTAVPSQTTAVLSPAATGPHATRTSTACPHGPRPTGWVAAENRHAGTRIWRQGANGSSPTVGYLDRTSAECGQTLALHLSGPGPWTRITAVRIGWYGGKGGRVVWRSNHIPTRHHHVPRAAVGTHLVEAYWPVSTRIPVTSRWVPGVYLLVLQPAFGRSSVVPLVVRHPAGAAALALMTSSLTWQAYNNFGGYSTYIGPGKDRTTRARVVSYDRPYAGSGLGHIYRYDLPLVRYVEQLGHDVDYLDDLDVQARPRRLLDHRAVIIPGHSEYWTRGMYDGATAARDAGVNLAFLGGNEVYWRARLARGAGGPNRRMMMYRSVKGDPRAALDPAAATVQWRQAPLNRPELALVGSDFGRFGVVGHFRVSSAGSWVFAGTGLRDGSVLPRSVNGEWDRVTTHPLTPPTIEVLAEAPMLEGNHATMATMSYYTAPSGAGVFNAGVTYLPCQLVDECPGVPTPPKTRRALRTIVANVLEAFRQEPAARRYPAHHRPPDEAAELVRVSRPADVGLIRPTRPG